VGFDPGGIGKGLAADRVVDELLARGATGACVNVGGDVRVEGVAPGGRGWVIAVDHPISGDTLAALRLGAGAVVSTWRTKRVWGAPDDVRHHLIDPATGAPSWSGLSGVVVTAARAWWAEVLAKAAYVAGPVDGVRVLERHGACGFLVGDDGVVVPVGAVEEFAA
jgi:thiamine biosynthesis lipoprotein